ncbi:hypothetical protein K440DRAFT_352070 [Wilcoxina mikolae CBS 423.85]|nr:hypothetical protein K440DRAFT_352070 [Wilcoxina mikolae CBS 423.85]
MILLAGRRAPCSSSRKRHIKPEICKMKTCKSKQRLGHCGIATSGTRVPRVPIVSQVTYKGVKILSSLRKLAVGVDVAIWRSNRYLSLRQTTILILLPHRNHSQNSNIPRERVFGAPLWGMWTPLRANGYPANIPACGMWGGFLVTFRFAFMNISTLQ